MTEKEDCLVGESNPGQLLGRQLCYLYTNEARYFLIGRCDLFSSQYTTVEHVPTRVPDRKVLELAMIGTAGLNCEAPAHCLLRRDFLIIFFLDSN